MSKLIETESVKILKALSHVTRLRIVKLLENGPMCVCKIAENLKLNQSIVSRHLALMKSAGIVSSNKEGMTVFYRLEMSTVTEILRIVENNVVERFEKRRKELQKTTKAENKELAPDE